MAWEQKRRPPHGYLTPTGRARVIAAHHGMCWVCGHGDAEQVDHKVCWSEWTRTNISVHHHTNVAPIHGMACPTCGAECHGDKTKAESARARARAQAKRKRPTEQHPGSIT